MTSPVRALSVFLFCFALPSCLLLQCHWSWETPKRENEGSCIYLAMENRGCVQIGLRQLREKVPILFLGKGKNPTSLPPPPKKKPHNGNNPMVRPTSQATLSSGPAFDAHACPTPNSRRAWLCALTPMPDDFFVTIQKGQPCLHMSIPVGCELIRMSAKEDENIICTRIYILWPSATKK